MGAEWSGRVAFAHLPPRTPNDRYPLATADLGKPRCLLRDNPVTMNAGCTWRPILKTTRLLLGALPDE